MHRFFSGGRLRGPSQSLCRPNVITLLRPSHLVLTLRPLSTMPCTLGVAAEMEGSPDAELDLKRIRDERKKKKEEQKAAKVAKASEKKAFNTKPKAGVEQTLRLKKEYENLTPYGQKKDLSGPMAAKYEPPAVEAAWYDWWVEKKFFKPEFALPGVDKEKREKFVIVLPPPNVTGTLHIGHALTSAIEDSLCRWHRMNGKEVLWLPGLDHAGISTQSVVEKKLAREEKLSKYDLGREKFVQRIWEWKKNYGGKILTQIRRMGCSVDWDREAFTMSESLQRAVLETFVRFYEAGVIYRANRLVNWCCALRTAISDIECDEEELESPSKLAVPGHGDRKYDFGYLWSFAYKVVGEEEVIVVATTRPETMLGDTAVAVHPDDPRYQHLHGKFLEHPFLDRKLPIVCDSILVKMEFGTGAVKVTPAHDNNDYEAGVRNNLEFINIFNEDGTLNEKTGEFKGMKRFDARVAVLKRLEQLKLYKGRQENKMVLKICAKSGDIIEPFLKPQWWVDITDMAYRSAQAVRNRDLIIMPSKRIETWYHYLDAPKPWCISRQLWWGHRIPAYLIIKDGEQSDTADPNSWIVARTEKEAYEMARQKLGPKVKFTLEQDNDVLDTWFSSGLFPFSTMGWPDNTSDMEKYFPNHLMETGHDIIFFWVARMVMMSFQLTGKLPFKEILLHPMVRDAHGRKMSKTLGNVVDPIDVVEGITLDDLLMKLKEGNLPEKEYATASEGMKKDFKDGISECGTDALRFGLCSYLSQLRDINLDIKRLEGYRSFCNKIWQATSLCLTFLGPDYKPLPRNKPLTGNEGRFDKWILNCLNKAAHQTNEALAHYELGQATDALYAYFYEICDVYLEVIKPTMYPKKGETPNVIAQKAIQATLYTIFDEVLRLMHPFMCYITEELWQRLPHDRNSVPESICVAAYPLPIPSRQNIKVETEVSKIMSIVQTIRSLLSLYSINKKKTPKVTLNVHSQELLDLFKDARQEVLTLAYLGELEVTLNVEGVPPQCATAIPDLTCEIYLHVAGLVDIEKEIVNLNKKLENLKNQISELSSSMDSADYVRKPESIREANAEKLEKWQSERNNVEQVLVTLSSFK